jgi:AraC-like DNA-binding protein
MRFPQHPRNSPALVRLAAQVQRCPALATVGLQMVIWSRTGPDWEATNHRLPWERLLVVLSGAYDIWLGDGFVTAPAGSLVWQHPDDRVWQRGAGTFCLLNGRSDGPIGRTIAQRPPAVVPADTAPLGTLVEACLVEAAHGADPAILGHLLAAIARMTVRCLGTQAIPADLAAAWEAVAADPAQNWSATRLARRLGIATETLRQHTLRHYGHSTRAHLAWLRLGHAADLLACDGLGVAEVARRCGYADTFAFSRAFRRRFGVPPSRWISPAAAANAPAVRPSPSRTRG